MQQTDSEFLKWITKLCLKARELGAVVWLTKDEADRLIKVVSAFLIEPTANTQVRPLPPGMFAICMGAMVAVKRSGAARYFEQFSGEEKEFLTTSVYGTPVIGEFDGGEFYIDGSDMPASLADIRPLGQITFSRLDYSHAPDIRLNYRFSGNVQGGYSNPADPPLYP